METTSDGIEFARLSSPEGANVVLDHIHPTGGVVAQFFYHVRASGETLRKAARALRIKVKADQFHIVSED